MIRKLIHATGRELQKVDFPGYDNAQRRGFDGSVSSSAAALNIPMGQSVWELSVANNVRRKADCDYIAGLSKLSNDQRAKHTFIFVTVRNWERKNDWTQEKNKRGDWKEVRAYDASDLEQWLETTVEPQIWLAEKLGIPTDGFQTIDVYWDNWASVTEPVMTPKFFAPTINKYKNEFKQWMESAPERPFIVVGDSREEATAFIACLLREIDCASASPRSAVVFDSVNALKSLTETTSPFIAVVCNEDVERSIAGAYRCRHYIIIVYPRNYPFRGVNPDITVNPLGPISFENALLDMGIPRERLGELARISGLSPMILRRHLSLVPAINRPPWAGKREIARKLVPMALLGAWNSEYEADREILETIADDSYSNIELAIAELHQMIECPIRYIGNHYGVVSKNDTIYAISPFMVKKDLTNFIDIAEYVLSETDPALDLPEDKRCDLYNKRREHSSMLRSGVRDTLVFLAVHGDQFFKNQLGVDVRAEISALTERLLTPLTSEKIESYGDDLPDIAEATPCVFLEVLKKDLEQTEPVLYSLLRPTNGDIFTTPTRTGLLWALERLSLYREHLKDVVDILTELSRIEINDNWGNKPVNSLASVFNFWFTQTAVPKEKIANLLKSLCEKFSDVGWEICIRKLKGKNSIIEYSTFPRWRPATDCVMNTADMVQMCEFKRVAFDVIVNLPNHNTRQLVDLLPLLPCWDEGDQSRVLDCIEEWAHTVSDENEIAEIRKQISRILYNKDGGSSYLYPKISTRLREIFQRLIPEDSFKRLALPFGDYWTHFLIAKEKDSSLERSDFQEQLDKARRQSMREILSSYGIDGVFRLLNEDNSGYTIGCYRGSSHGDDMQSAVELVRRCLNNNTLSSEKVDAFLQGFFEKFGDNISAEFMLSLVTGISDSSVVRILKCLRFNRETWNLIDKLENETIRNQYWMNISVPLMEYSEYETEKLVDNLLDADRPWRAFDALRMDWDRVETSVLMRLLKGVTKIGLQLNQINYSGHVAYYMPKALRSLAKRPGVSLDEMARLEFASIEWSHPSKCEVSNLEKQIEGSPKKFVYFLYLITGRDGKGQVPIESHINDDVVRRALVSRAWLLFELLRRIPGQDDKGEIDLQVLLGWISEVRQIARDQGLIEICDINIGQWLSRGSKPEDNPWPKRSICEALEYIASEEVGSGFIMGVRNAHGFISRSSYEGGGKERTLANKYHQRAKVWEFEFPFVSKILKSIADSYDKAAEREDQDARLRQVRDL